MHEDELESLSDSALWDALQGAVGCEKAEILLELGRRAERAGQLTAAESLFEQAKAEFEAMGNTPGVGQSWAYLASVFDDSNRFREAADAHAASAEAFIAVNVSKMSTLELARQSHSLLLLGEYGAARDAADSALALAVAESEPTIAGLACYWKARALHAMDQDAEALDVCEEARAHFRESEDFPTEMVAELYDFALTIALDLIRPDDALHFARSAYVLAKSTSSQEGAAHAAVRLASAHMERDEHSEALALATEAADLYRAEDDLRGLAASQKIQADALYALRDDDERCRAIYADTKVLFENLGMESQAFLCGVHISTSLWRSRLRAEAVSYERQLLPTAPLRIDACWSAARLAMYEFHTGEPAKALATAERADGLWDDPPWDVASRRSILSSRARALHELGRREEAATVAAEVLSLTRPGSYDYDTAFMSEYQAEALGAMGHEDYPFHLAQAMALHVSHGCRDRARELAKYFISEGYPLMPVPDGPGVRCSDGAPQEELSLSALNLDRLNER